MVEMMVKALKNPYMIKTTHLDIDKDQTDISSADETHSLSFTATIIITVKGMY